MHQRCWLDRLGSMQRAKAPHQPWVVEITGACMYGRKQQLVHTRMQAREDEAVNHVVNHYLVHAIMHALAQNREF
jgi:Zn-dependent peptidase ImmA (M78 family)